MTEVGKDAECRSDSGRILRFSFRSGAGVKNLWKNRTGSRVSLYFRQ